MEKYNYKVLKIITLILYIVATVIAVVLMIDPIVKNSANENAGAAIALILLAPLSIVVYAVPTILSLAGLITAFINYLRKKTTLGTLIYFIVFTVLPYLTFYIIILVLQLII